jgi:anionic cell wall polymer biosynthesis LytR-Cps2A-Psr (LCP) family protein
MDAIPVVNDLAGGVTVHIDDDFSAVDPSLEQGRDVRLQGEQALTFVRGRMYVDDGSNLSRMNRQREFINALYGQLTQKLQEDGGFAARLASRLADYSVSDLTTTELSNLADQLKDYRFTGIRTIAGDAVKGEKYMEFYTDESELRSLVKEVFFTKARVQ